MWCALQERGGHGADRAWCNLANTNREFHFVGWGLGFRFVGVVGGAHASRKANSKRDSERSCSFGERRRFRLDCLG